MMQTLIDAGPLVAFLSKEDQHHAWAVRQWAECPPPFLTCEPVLSEACFLLFRSRESPVAVIELVRRGVLQIDFSVQTEADSVAQLMRAYADAPMSLADACLVRLSELHHASRVLTLDRHFARYRRSGRRVIPLLSPW